MSLTVRRHDTLCELESLTYGWRQLWERSPEATVFQLPAWLLPWCRHLLRGELQVLSFWRGTLLVGLAPFFAWRDGSQRVLSLLGAGASDYCDLLVEPDARTDVGEALREWLDAGCDWQRCEWSELRPGSLLLSIRPRLRREETEAQEVCPGLPLPPAAELPGLLPAGRLAKLRQARRRAEREHSVAFETVRPQTFEALFDKLELLHDARWGALDGPLDPALKAFRRSAARQLLACDALSLSGMRLDGELVAVLYGFNDRQAVRYYMQGIDPRHAKLSLGTQLL
ncbi:MAG: hypothetical protein JWN48_2615, partial [Myxococcaceae bacterium]|nr:hypothetical protein [Myxococcaceae bacterium]